MGFFRLILIFALVYLIILLFVRYIFPFILKRFISKQFGFHEEKSRSKEGEVKMSGKPESKEKIIPRDEGEYVNYEDVE